MANPKDNINIKNVESLIKAQQNANNDLETSVYGSTNNVEQDALKTKSLVNDTVSALIQQDAESMNSDIVGTLEKYYNSQGIKVKRHLDKLKSLLQTWTMQMIFINTIPKSMLRLVSMKI